MSTELEEKPSTAVTVVERAALALGADTHEKELVALSKKYVDIVEIKNPAGRQQCHAAAMELSNARIATTKTGETAREDANAFQKAVIAEVKRRIAIISAEETRLLALRDAWDKEREAEKIVKALAESQRITAIRQKIDATRNAPQQWINKSSADIGAAADHLSETVVTLDEFAEYLGEATVERDVAVNQLRTMQEAMRHHEEAQAALEIERQRLAREREAAEERERVAAEERAAQEKKDRAARLEQERRDREVREQAEADQREAVRRAQEAMDAEREAHEARMAAQQAEIDAKQAAVDAAAAEQERVAREAREAQEAVDRRKQEAADLTARLIDERIQAEKDAAEAAELAARRAAEEEAERRERVNFIKNGPAPEQIILALADEYRVDAAVARDWLALRDWKLVEVA